MKNEACGGKIIFEKVNALDIGLTLDCGQAFRWVQKPNGAWHAVADGTVELSSLAYEDMDKCREDLMKIKGVGAKVAECTLLYGCGRIEAFPVDVWVKRIMAELYPEGLPECTEGVEGIAQQFLFHWRRNTEI